MFYKDRARLRPCTKGCCIQFQENNEKPPARSFYLGETFKVKKKIDTGYF